MKNYRQMFKLLVDNLEEDPWDSLAVRDDGLAVLGPSSHTGWVIVIEEMGAFRDLLLGRKEALQKKTVMDAQLKELGHPNLVQNDPSIQEPGLTVRVVGTSAEQRHT